MMKLLNTKYGSIGTLTFVVLTIMDCTKNEENTSIISTDLVEVKHCPVIVGVKKKSSLDEDNDHAMKPNCEGDIVDNDHAMKPNCEGDIVDASIAIQCNIEEKYKTTKLIKNEGEIKEMEQLLISFDNEDNQLRSISMSKNDNLIEQSLELTDISDGN